LTFDHVPQRTGFGTVSPLFGGRITCEPTGTDLPTSPKPTFGQLGGIHFRGCGLYGYDVKELIAKQRAAGMR
jgi:hypothetical protein